MLATNYAFPSSISLEGEDWRYELLLHLDLGLLKLIDLLSNHLHLLELTGYWRR